MQSDERYGTSAREATQNGQWTDVNMSPKRLLGRSHLLAGTSIWLVIGVLIYVVSASAPAGNAPLLAVDRMNHGANSRVFDGCRSVPHAQVPAGNSRSKPDLCFLSHAALALFITALFLAAPRRLWGLRPDAPNDGDRSDAEQTYQEALSQLPAGVFIVDPQTRILEWANLYAAEMFGVPVDQIVGKRCCEFISMGSDDACPLCDAGLESDNAFRELLCADGSHAPVLKTAKRITWGGQDKLIEVFIDVREYKSLSDELVRAKERFDLVMSVSRDGIWDFDLVPQAVYFSPGWKAMLGYEDAELANDLQTFKNLIFEDDLQHVSDQFEQFLAGKTDEYWAEFRMKHRDGTLRWIQAKGTARKNANHEIVRIAGCHRDITEEKSAQNELLNQTELLKTLIAIDNDFLNVTEEKTDDVIYAALGMLGRYTQSDRVYVFLYDHEEQICINTHEWCAEGIAPEIDNVQAVPLEEIPDWTAAHFAGERIYIPDVQQLPEGSGLRNILEPQQIQSLLTLPMMQGDECIGFVGFDAVRQKRSFTEEEIGLLSFFSMMLVNITSHIHAFKRIDYARKEAESASQAKSMFLANMSHEIRTPLTAILGCAQMLERDPALSGRHKEQLHAVIRSGGHLLELLNDILDLSKAEAGKVEVIPEPFDITQLLEDLSLMFGYRAETKHLDLMVKWEGTEPERVVADKGKLRQVLINLLGNAVKFTDTGSVILRAWREDRRDAVSGAQHHRLVFEVQDTGPGIPKEELNTIFDLFSQGKAGAKAGGTGLGLAISKRYIELMGGELHVESQPGKGSLFRFSINCLDANVAPQRTIREGVGAVNTDSAATFDPGLSPVSSPAADPAGASQTLIDLAEDLPEELTRALAEATMEGDVNRLLLLIDQTEALSIDLAKGLRNLADRYDYDTMLRILACKPNH